MSVAHKLLNIETSIAYEDVDASWKFSREVWMCDVVQAGSEPHKLAALTLQLLSALTPGCIEYYWSKPAAFQQLSEVCKGLANTSRSTRDAEAAIMSVMVELVGVIVMPNHTELNLLSDGKPDAYGVGMIGPDLEVGDTCGALDIRMAWCPAQIVLRRTGPGGQVQYRVHYDGWKKRWDEWVARDSGRIRRDVPNEAPPKRMNLKGGTQIAQANAGKRERVPPASAKTVTSEKDEMSTLSLGMPVKARDEGMGKMGKKQRLEDKGGVFSSTEGTETPKKTVSGQSASSSAATTTASHNNADSEARAGMSPPPANSIAIPPGGLVNIGEKLVAVDCRGVWCECRAVDIRNAKHDKNSMSQLRCRYVGWGSKWDEWIRLESGKVRRLAESAQATTGAKGGDGGRTEGVRSTKPGREAKPRPKPKESIAEKVSLKEAGNDGSKTGSSGANWGPRRRPESDSPKMAAQQVANSKNTTPSSAGGGASGKTKLGGGGRGASKGKVSSSETLAVKTIAAKITFKSGITTVAPGAKKQKQKRLSSANPPLMHVRLRLSGYIGHAKPSGLRYSMRPMTAASVRLDEDTILDRAPTDTRKRKKARSSSHSIVSRAPRASHPEYDDAAFGSGAAPSIPHFAVGDPCWARDIRSRWCHATVRAIATGKAKVHYTGWGKKWDEWKGLDDRPIQVRVYEMLDGDGDFAQQTQEAAMPISAMQVIAHDVGGKWVGSGGSRTKRKAGGSGGDDCYGARRAKRDRPAAAGKWEASSCQYGPCRPSFGGYAFQSQSDGTMMQRDDLCTAGGQHGLGGAFDPVQAPQRWAGSPHPAPYMDMGLYDGGDSGIPASDRVMPADGPFDIDAAIAKGAPSLASLDESALRDKLKSLQLTRDFLRTLQTTPQLMARTQHYFVRLNMGSRFFLYVAAQIVQINGDELQEYTPLISYRPNQLSHSQNSRNFTHIPPQDTHRFALRPQVRGVDKHLPLNVQRTKLAYVSNAQFKDDEITEVIRKLRARHIRDMPLSHVDQMIAVRREMTKHAGCAAACGSTSISAAGTSNGGDAPSQAVVAQPLQRLPAAAQGPVLAQVPIIPPTSMLMAPPRFACCDPASTTPYTIQASAGLGFTHHAVIMQGDTNASHVPGGFPNPAQFQMAPLAPPTGSLLADGPDGISGDAGQRPKMACCGTGSAPFVMPQMGYEWQSAGYADQMAPMRQPCLETLHSAWQSSQQRLRGGWAQSFRSDTIVPLPNEQHEQHTQHEQHEQQVQQVLQVQQVQEQEEKQQQEQPGHQHGAFSTSV